MVPCWVTRVLTERSGSWKRLICRVSSGWMMYSVPAVEAISAGRVFREASAGWPWRIPWSGCCSARSCQENESSVSRQTKRGQRWNLRISDSRAVRLVMIWCSTLPPRMVLELEMKQRSYRGDVLIERKGFDRRTILVELIKETHQDVFGDVVIHTGPEFVVIILASFENAGGNRESLLILIVLVGDAGQKGDLVLPGFLPQVELGAGGFVIIIGCDDRRIHLARNRKLRGGALGKVRFQIERGDHVVAAFQPRAGVVPA